MQSTCTQKYHFHEADKHHAPGAVAVDADEVAGATGEWACGVEEVPEGDVLS